MGSRDYGFSYNDCTIFEYIQQDARSSSESKLERDFFVYVMGPYTAFSATYAFEKEGEKLKSPFIDDPLFDPDHHVDDDGKGRYEWALGELCDDLCDKFGVHAFIATDIDIPTREDAETIDGEDGLSVLDQSIAFAAVSDAVIFIFTQAGLTPGVSSELGAILGEFHLRTGNSEPIRKPRERFKMFQGPDFGSASIEEIPHTYGVRQNKFDTKDELIDQIQQFLVNVERTARDRPFPIYNPYRGN